MMQLRQVLSVSALLAATTAASSAATTFIDAANSAASATWETWIFESSTVASGSQGAAGSFSSAGSISFSSNEVTIDILQGYDSPPGGFLGNPDTYYVHNGAFSWTVDATLSANIDYVRVSYSLIGFGGGAPTAFDNAPSLDVAASQIGSGSYEAGSTVFYTDFQLTAPGNEFSIDFGDIVTPGFYPGSFRSMDGIFVEVFSGSAPAVVPEASTSSLLAGLFALVACTTWRRKARK